MADKIEFLLFFLQKFLIINFCLLAIGIVILFCTSDFFRNILNKK